jgi:uncharacterized protein (DUF983 family)
MQGGTMKNETKVSRPNLFWSLFNQKCPRCRTGDMFRTRRVYDLKRFMKMNEKCPVCGQRMEIEIGFYYGTSYISYALTVALSAFTFVAWWLTIGFSLEDNRLFFWIGINGLLLLLLQPWLMRLSRAVWLSFFVHYNMNWEQPDPGEAERLDT